MRLLKLPSNLQTQFRLFTQPTAPRRKSSQSLSEAYGVIIAPGLGERRLQPLRTNRWKRQPILPGLRAIDDWSATHWSFRPQYVPLSCSVRLQLTYLLDRSVINIPVIGIPASLAFAFGLPPGTLPPSLTFSRFGAVYMICAVGVYV